MKVLLEKISICFTKFSRRSTIWHPRSQHTHQLAKGALTSGTAGTHSHRKWHVCVKFRDEFLDRKSSCKRTLVQVWNAECRSVGPKPHKTLALSQFYFNIRKTASRNATGWVEKKNGFENTSLKYNWGNSQVEVTVRSCSSNYWTLKCHPNRFVAHEKGHSITHSKLNALHRCDSTR